MSKKEVNLEDRKSLGLEMRDIIWQRDNRSCKRCNRVLYKSRSPQGHIHHIDSNSANNKQSNLVLLCPACHHKLHQFYNSKMNRYSLEIEIITGIKSLYSIVPMADGRYGHTHYWTSQYIDELEREHELLALPEEDMARLKQLKVLEREFSIAEDNKAKEEKEEDNMAKKLTFGVVEI